MAVEIGRQSGSLLDRVFSAQNGPMKDNFARLLAILSLAVAAISAYFSYRQSVAKFAELRPVVVPRLEELSFDREKAKCAIVFENLGRTTASIVHVRLTLHEDKSRSVWVSGLENALIYPGKSRRCAFFASRPTPLDVGSFDPVEAIKQAGHIAVTMTYACKELPGETYTEGVELSGFSWQDKSVVGVGE